MTPNETHLVDAMASALSRGSPDVASNLKPTINLKIEHCDLGNFTEVHWSSAVPGMIEISTKTDSIALNPEMVQGLDEFLGRIGWRPQ